MLARNKKRTKNKFGEVSSGCMSIDFMPDFFNDTKEKESLHTFVLRGK